MVNYIMLKDEPVLKIDNYKCEILDFDRLPIALLREKTFHGRT